MHLAKGGKLYSSSLVLYLPKTEGEIDNYVPFSCDISSTSTFLLQHFQSTSTSLSHQPYSYVCVLYMIARDVARSLTTILAHFSTLFIRLLQTQK